MPIRTLADLVFVIRDRSAGRHDLLSVKRRGRLEEVSTSSFLSDVQALALALQGRGANKGDRVVIFSENRPEWHVVDFACQLLGLVSVPIYPTVASDQVAFILKNCGPRWAFVSSAEKAAQIAEIRPSLTRELGLVSFDGGGEATSLTEVLAEGAPLLPGEPLDRMRNRVEPSDLASLIYTSGTTGDPKGVMLTHHNVVSNVLACQDLFELGPDDLALSFLPLSHIFERMVDYLFFLKGVAIHYAPSIERVPPLMLEIRPTVMTSVPRLYERAFLKVNANVKKESPTKQKLFEWAIGVGTRYAAASTDRFVGPLLGLQRAIAHRLVFRKIHQRFGGRLRFAISGGAPLGDEVAQFFDAVGLQLYQGYGLTETSPVLTVNSPGAKRRGAVGRAVPGVELRIAEDGEILARGAGVMAGYWENEEATRETIDPDGWLHTGDIGRLDDDGFLFITDRKKDLLITSGGKNVAPAPIEQHLVAQWVISQAVVFGDRYPFLTALIVPQFEELPAEIHELDRERAIEHPTLLEIVGQAVSTVNERLSDHERIRKWRLLAHELTIEKGEITPTLKVRRRQVRDRYAEVIDSMYLKTQKVGS
ncbi:MAG: long-chain fatty acid--CoA ligase [Acidobacteria bacterium]|nr:MAG: long-chain fatty acid--CoA ligase [Acidobacteriota bacterium]